MTEKEAIARVEKYIKSFNGNALDCVAIGTVLTLLEKKDKIIDLMAEEISENITNTCPFADYNYDLDCENKCNDNYKECWKQYFENKVKEVQNGKHIS